MFHSYEKLAILKLIQNVITTDLFININITVPLHHSTKGSTQKASISMGFILCTASHRVSNITEYLKTWSRNNQNIYLFIYY